MKMYLTVVVLLLVVSCAYAQVPDAPTNAVVPALGADNATAPPAPDVMSADDQPTAGELATAKAEAEKNAKDADMWRSEAVSLQKRLLNVMSPKSPSGVPSTPRAKAARQNHARTNLKPKAGRRTVYQKSAVYVQSVSCSFEKKFDQWRKGLRARLHNIELNISWLWSEVNGLKGREKSRDAKIQALEDWRDGKTTAPAPPVATAKIPPAIDEEATDNPEAPAAPATAKETVSVPDVVAPVADDYVATSKYNADQQKVAEKLAELTTQAQTAYDNSETAITKSNIATDAATKASEAVTSVADTANNNTACQNIWIWIIGIVALFAAIAVVWHWATGRHRCIACGGLGCPCCRDHHPAPASEEGPATDLPAAV